MFDYSLRKFTPRYLAPIARFVPRRVSANQLTFISFILSIFCIVLIANSYFLLALVFFTLTRIFDGLDGFIARQRNQESQYGHVYDITSDFFIYSFIPIAIAFENSTQQSALIAAIMIATYYINAAIWMSISKATEKESRGLVEGLETIIAYFAIIAFSNYFDLIGSIFAFLVALTAIIRLTTLILDNELKH